MFSKNVKKAQNPKVMERNVIAKNTVIVGDIKSDGDFRIDGTLEGSLITNGRVIIGVEGFVKGNIEASNADIEGKISGKVLISKTLTIKATSLITGDVIVGKLSVELGATFNATCSMKGAVKELNQANEQQKLSEKTA
ncbi:polymer-forming cytoskeletal protein [Polaribacter sp. HL-MS24]|uniref:bactofilin family protein n=1 Tax=Polaribacter sp. HL-MS24 TaxID=3077735 RepID=UPI0029353359|nr:polymer-forming cytoskeletal protein [Polaribacter sp. HL-MS24]WOC41140.1 polymer-forming cytoskeletal protein [Polaribacter sp. HL-MS24]